MASDEPLSDVVNRSDPGDSVLQRFDYQAAYTAQLAAGLLFDDVPFFEIFCEHHEDVLILLKDGSYHAVQIKTKEPNLDPFKATDDTVLKVIRKFAHLEQEYGSQVSRYILVANVGFWDVSKQDPKNLHYICWHAQNLQTPRKNKSNAALFDFVEAAVDRPQKPFALNVLRKLELETATSRFEDLQAVLVGIISQIPAFRTKTYIELAEFAKQLTAEIKHASQRELKGGISEFFVYQADPQKMRNDALIEGKRISETRVSELVGKYTAEKPLLRAGNAPDVDKLPRGISRTVLKMAAGKLSVENIDLVKDCKFSAELELDRWIQKYGAEKAKERYQHLLTTTRFACQDAHDRSYLKNDPFGTNMLIEVRGLLSKLSDERAGDVFGFGPELLLGVAGILTESCKLWWSDKFELVGDSNDSV